MEKSASYTERCADAYHAYRVQTKYCGNRLIKNSDKQFYYGGVCPDYTYLPSTQTQKHGLPTYRITDTRSGRETTKRIEKNAKELIMNVMILCYDSRFVSSCEVL